MNLDKVILVIPVDRIDFNPLTYPPLGLLYIAAALEKEFVVEVFDMREEYNTIDKIGEADYYGFTATTSQFDDVLYCVNFLKRKNKKSFYFIGGSHASWMYEEIKHDFNATIVGEADLQIIDILKSKKEGVFYCNLKKENLDEIPFPARHLMLSNRIVSSDLWDGEGYQKENCSTLATTLITSRGCPWKCSFCANIPQKVNYRSEENIIKEIEKIIEEYTCRNFRFLDDNFLMNKKRLFQLLPMLKTKNISYRCSGRSDLIDDNICKLLYESGCKEIGFGVETADDEVLKLINKGESVEEHERAIKLAKQNNLRVKIFMMAGLPLESWETIEKNKRFIEKTQPDKVIVTLFTPYPGSDAYRFPEKYKIKIKQDEWKSFFQTYPSKSIISTDKCSSEELTEHHETMINFLLDFNKKNKYDLLKQK